MKYLGWLILLGVGSSSSVLARELIEFEYRLLATGRTSTMERELNEAALDGFVLVSAIGGETAHGGRELVAILSRPFETNRIVPAEYLVLATNRTGTMQNELELERAHALGDAFLVSAHHAQKLGVPLVRDDVVGLELDGFQKIRFGRFPVPNPAGTRYRPASHRLRQDPGRVSELPLLRFALWPWQQLEGCPDPRRTIGRRSQCRNPRPT